MSEAESKAADGEDSQGAHRRAQVVLAPPGLMHKV